MSLHAAQVRKIADAIELNEPLRRQIACLALQLSKPPNEILAQALSELRSLRAAECDEPSCDAD